jgi:cyclopropane-fatty-acyl-phospholipid synthase
VTQTQTRPTTTGVAGRLAEAVRPFVGGDLPVHLTAWDGSTAGPEDAPRVVLHTPDAVRRMVWHPGELGAAQAYVTGELDVEGDLGEALTHAFAVAHERGLMNKRPSPSASSAGPRLPQPRRHSCVAGCTASCATGRRSATTTTSPTTSTS